MTSIAFSPFEIATAGLRRRPDMTRAAGTADAVGSSPRHGNKAA